MMTENKKKMSCWKKIAIWCGCILVVLAILLGCLILYLGQILEKAIPEIGTRLSGCKVEVSGVRCSLLGGSFQLKDFKVANPRGFQQPYAIEVRDFSVAVDVSSLFSDTIVVECVELSGMRLDYEYRFSGSNLDVLLKRLQQADERERQQRSAADRQQERPAASASSVQVLIRRIDFSDSQILFSNSTLRSSIPVVLPQLILKDIGGNGASITGNVLEVFQKLIPAVLETVKANGISATEKGGDFLNTVLDTGKKAIKDTAPETVEQIGDGIKGLFR